MFASIILIISSPSATLVFVPVITCPTTKSAVPPGIVRMVGVALENVIFAAPLAFAADQSCASGLLLIDLIFLQSSWLTPGEKHCSKRSSASVFPLCARKFG